MTIPTARPARLSLALLLLLLNPSAVAGSMCTLDVVPAATLLLPYFEVDVSSPEGVTTTLSLTNATAEPTVVHATLWTDWNIPTVDFDVFFTGHDVVVFDLRALLVDGMAPLTADEARDPDDVISPHGDHPEWDGTFPSCESLLPLPPLPGALRQYLVESHTGQPLTISPGQCQGQDHGDGIARGYVTVDVTNGCGLLFPGASGYFGEGGTGVASDENRLLGEVELSHPAAGTAVSMPLVHIEAAPAFAPPSGATFYGRLVNNSGTDDREPLGSAWSVRYRNDPPVVSEFSIWRDSTVKFASSYDCSLGPPWAPIDETEVRCFSESAEVDITCASGGGDCFPLATQSVALSSLPVPFVAGVCELDLNHFCSGCVPGGHGSHRNVAQSFAASRSVQTPGMSMAATLSAGAMLRSACEDASAPFPLIFADGFESGDTAAWTPAP